jgi:hypothetical protein
MAKTKISEFSATPGNNTDIDGINIAEGCAPSGINDAIRELMAQLKDFQAGTAGDSFNGPVGTTTAAAGAFTTLSASSTVSGTGFSTYLASPPAIGGTTAAAGSFTTLSASGNVTLSGGTANGVAYLNGSKVLTTGSALTFDGTNLYTTGKAFIGGTADGGEKVQIESTAGAQLALRYAPGTTWSLQTNSGGGLQWNYNGSEQMRLTSTGLGIGTSSPTSKLDVSGGSSTGGLTVSGSIASVRASSTVIDTGDGNRIMALGANTTTPGTLKFIVASSNASIYTTAATLDAAGNLGLGVTPSAWFSNRKAIQINNAGSSIAGFSGGGLTEIRNNSFLNDAGSEIYASTNPAAVYQMNNGSHAWFTAPSGTAGNAISFTQAMTLDASGRLGVGTTSPQMRIHAVGSGEDQAEVQSQNTSASSNCRATVRVKSATSTFGGGLMMTNGTDSAYPTSVLCLYNYDNQPLVFGTNNTERARIDASGNLLLNLTSASGRGGVFNVNGVPNDRVSIDSLQNASTSQAHIYFRNSNGLVGSITTNGSATSYITSSDYRLKEDIQPMTGALAKVAALKPCTYKWKADGSDGEGFIAHELAEVVPQCVTGEKDAVDEEGKPVYQGIDTSFLVATLTAAIQELKAEFDAYKASHP